MNKSVTRYWVALSLIVTLLPAAARPDPYEAALDFYAAEQFEAAVIELRNVLQESPGNVPARVLLGRVFLEQDKPREAAAELEKGLELGGDQNLILVPLGQAYLQLLEPEKVLTGVIPPRTDAVVDGEVLLLHGDAALLLGDLNYAARSFAGARERLSADSRPLVGEARIALARGRGELADELIGAALESDPDSLGAWTLKGMVHRDRGDYEGSRAALDRALELAPRSTKALGARAALFLDLGDAPAAAADVAVLREINPGDLEGLYLHSWLLVSKGDHDEALRLLQERVDELRAIGQDHLEKLPQTELLFGIVNFLSDDYEQAVERLKRFLVRFPAHTGAKRYLAATYLSAGEWDKVTRTLSPAPGAELPSHPATLSLLAEAHRATGNLSRATRLYERAIEIAPDQVGFAMGLAMSRFAAGHTVDGIRAMESLIREVPDFQQAKTHLISMYLKAGYDEEALKLAHGLAEMHPDDAAIQNLLGATMMASGRFGTAKKQFELAEKLEPTDVLPLLNQARLALRIDDIGAENR
ncbi:MAG TPA: tetratricopeptide repeat protein [Gammaproteobacteria bacterium]|nr:tetratricopeptide repeat protein [Gammaproteobacteria bacterium]